MKVINIVRFSGSLCDCAGVQDFNLSVLGITGWASREQLQTDCGKIERRRDVKIEMGAIEDENSEGYTAL